MLCFCFSKTERSLAKKRHAGLGHDTIYATPVLFAEIDLLFIGGWSSGAVLLGNLPAPGRPTDLDWSRARAYCACSRYGWGLFGHFFLLSIISLFFSLSLGDGRI